MKKTTTLFLTFTLLAIKSFSQVVTWSPAFPVDNDSITVIFNAAQGNGALNNTTTDVYAHTGVLTNLSTSPTDWKHVISGWAVNIPAAKMQSLGGNLYKLRFHIRNYYNVPGTETIKKLAFVFRNPTGTITAKTAAGSDIFIPVFSNALNCYISDPVYTAAGIPNFVPVNSSFSITGISSATATLSVYLNNVYVNQASGTSVNSIITPTSQGTNWVKLVATDGITTALDSFSFVANAPTVTQAVPPNAKDGVTYLNDSTIYLNLTAPNKGFVYVLGDFNNWTAGPAAAMKKTPDGKRFWIQIDHLVAGKEYVYQYLIDGNLKVADPYSEKILDPSNDGSIGSFAYPTPTIYPTGKTTGIASVLQTAQVPYPWQVNGFNKPKKTDLVIYELLIRDFIATHSYRTLIDTLDYLKNLGVNAIELMPVNEFEGNQSWGYNPNYYFTPDKYYGTKNKFKEFIDACHLRGIAVIMDIALNHAFGSSPMVQMYWDAANSRPAADNPWFNPIAKHDFNVGNDFNHGSGDTKYFTKNVVNHWIVNYKIDGFRFDLAKGFTQVNTLGNTGLWGQYDQSRVDIWKEYYDAIHLTDPSSYTILEYFADNSEETVLANYGMMLWGNLVNNYNQSSMGYASSSDLSWGSYKSRGWNQPNLVTYMESHDEERLMYKNIQYGGSVVGYNTKDTTTALRRMEEAAAFFFTIPGPKMIWQFGEVGYDYSINYSCRICNKPIKWNYFSNPNRKRLYDIYGALAKFKTTQPAMESTNYTLSVGNLQKSIHINYPGMNITVVGNFDVITQSMNPNFQSTGYWYDYLSGDSIYVSNATAARSMQAGEYHVYTSARVPLPNTITAIKNVYANNGFAAFSSYPNPTDDVSYITFEADKVSDVSVKIFDLLGNEVVTLADNQKLILGHHEWMWNLKNKNGARVAKGMYVIKITSNGVAETGKIVVE